MAQRGVNKVILIGKLGSDPEIKELANGKMATISLATSETWKDKQTGEQREQTEWHRVTVFGPVAGILEQYATKGTQVYVEAQLKTNKWQDQDGKDQYTLQIVVQGFGTGIQLLGGGQAQQNSGQAQQGNATPPAPSQPVQQAPQQSAPPADDDDDDIPF